MDATDPAQPDPARRCADDPTPARPARRPWYRWAAAVGMPLLAVVVIGAAGQGARALFAVEVLPAVHVLAATEPATRPGDDDLPLADIADKTADVLETAAPLDLYVPPAAIPLPGAGELVEHEGVAYRVAETILMEVTAYCPCRKCCGPLAHGVTASGRPVSHNAGRFVAADPRVLPFHSMIRVPGYHGEAGQVVEVLDRGGAIKGRKLDVFFPDHKTALKWGRQTLPVQVLEPVLERVESPQ